MHKKINEEIINNPGSTQQYDIGDKFHPSRQTLTIRNNIMVKIKNFYLYHVLAVITLNLNSHVLNEEKWLKIFTGK